MNGIPPLQQPEDDLPITPVLQGPQPQGPQPQEPAQSVTGRFVERLKLREDAALLQTFQSAIQLDPDLAGETQRIAKELNVSPEVVQADLGWAKRLLAANEVRRNVLAQVDPTLRQQMSDPDFAAIAWDDLNNISTFDRITGNFKAGRLEVERGKIGHKMMSGYATDRDRQRLAEIDYLLHETLPSGDSWIGGPFRLFGQMTKTLPKAFALGSVAAGTAAAAGQAGPQIALPEEVISMPLAFTFGMVTGMAHEAFLIEGGNAYADYIEAGMDPTVAHNAARIVGLANSAFETAGFSILTAPVKKFVRDRLRRAVGQRLTRLTPMQATLRALRDGSTAAGGEIVTETLQETSLMIGEEVARYNSDTLTARIQGGFRGRMKSPLGLGKGGDWSVNVDGRGQVTVGAALFEAVMGLKPGDGPVVLSGDGRRKFLAQYDQILPITSAIQQGQFVDRLLDTAWFTLKGVWLPGVAGPAVRLIGDRHRLHSANVTQNVLTAAQENVADAKAQARNADVYTQFIASNLQGERAETVYVTKRAVREKMEAVGATEEQLEADLPDVLRQLRESEELNEDIEIPLADWLGKKMVETDLGTALKEDIRVGGKNDMSFAEAKQALPQIEAQVQELREQVEGGMEAQQRFDREASAVQERIRQELAATGNFRAEQSRVLAAMHRRIVELRALRQKLSPAEFEEKYGRFRVVRGADGQPVMVQLRQGARRPTVDAAEFETDDLSDSAEFPGWKASPEGKLIGYRVSRSVGGAAVSGADSRQRAPTAPGGRILFDGQGTFVSNDIRYVVENYAVHDANVLQQVEFDPAEVTSGALSDEQPEVSVASATVRMSRDIGGAEDPDILLQTDISGTTYSALASAVLNTQSKKQQGAGFWRQQLKAWLNAGKVTENEVFWTGFEDLLDVMESANVKVTPRQLHNAFVRRPDGGDTTREATRLAEGVGAGAVEVLETDSARGVAFDEFTRADEELESNPERSNFTVEREDEIRNGHWDDFDGEAENSLVEAFLDYHVARKVGVIPVNAQDLAKLEEIDQAEAERLAYDMNQGVVVSANIFPDPPESTDVVPAFVTGRKSHPAYNDTFAEKFHELIETRKSDGAEIKFWRLPSSFSNANVTSRYYIEESGRVAEQFENEFWDSEEQAEAVLDEAYPEISIIYYTADVRGQRRHFTLTNEEYYHSLSDDETGAIISEGDEQLNDDEYVETLVEEWVEQEYGDLDETVPIHTDYSSYAVHPEDPPPNYRELSYRFGGPSLRPGKAPGRPHAHVHFSGSFMHMRTFDVYDTDGNRLLYVQEMQSDWARGGEKMGRFKFKPEELKKLRAQMETLERQWQAAADEAASTEQALLDDNYPAFEALRERKEIDGHTLSPRTFSLELRHPGTNELRAHVRMMTGRYGAVQVRRFSAQVTDAELRRLVVALMEQGISEIHLEDSDARVDLANVADDAAAALKINVVDGNILRRPERQRLVDAQLKAERKMASTGKQLSALRESIEASETGKVDTAPFVTSLNSWVDFGLKRLAALAINENYDGIVFITGDEAQASSYGKLKGQRAFYDKFLPGRLKALYEKKGKARVEKIQVPEIRVQQATGSDPDGMSPEDVNRERRERRDEFVIATGNLKQLADDVAQTRHAQRIEAGEESDLVPVHWEPPSLLSHVEHLPERQGRQIEEAVEEYETAKRRAAWNPGVYLNEKFGRKFGGEQPVFQDPERPRGAIDLTSLVAVLFEKGDVSTFFHEAAHYYFEVMLNIARAGDATEELISDLDTVAKWGGFAGWSDMLNTTRQRRKKLHEAFAYTFEFYLSNGKPRTADRTLLDALRRVRRWIVNVYKDAVRQRTAESFSNEFQEDLPAFSEEIREVMDRLLQTQEMIDYAKKVRSVGALFEIAEDAAVLQALPPEQRERLREMIVDADYEAEEKLGAVMLRQLRYLKNFRSRFMQEIQKQTRDARRRLREEVYEEVKLDPVHRLQHFLDTGEFLNPQGEPEPADVPHRLNEAGLPAKWTSRTGLPADVLAPMFDYPSGLDLLEDLRTAPTLDEVVDARTDERMQAEHGDLLDEKIIEEKLIEALSGPAFQRLIAEQIRMFDQGLPSARLQAAAARDVARRVVGEQRVDSLRPINYSIAAGRAQRAAAEARRAGDIPAYRAELRRALFQNALAEAAIEAREEVRKGTSRIRERFQRTDKKLAQQRRLVPLVKAGRLILSRYGLTTPSPESIDDPGFDPLEPLAEDDPLRTEMTRVIADEVKDAQPFETLTVDELRETFELADSLWFRSKREREIMLEGERAELEQVVGKMLDTLNEHNVKERAVAGALSKSEKKGRWLRRQLAQFKRMEFALKALDRGRPDGIFTKAIWRRAKDAANEMRLDESRYLKKLQDMVNKLDLPGGTIVARGLVLTSEGGTKDFVFGHDGTSGKGQLLMALLHSGNLSNLFKFVHGYKIGQFDRSTQTVDTSRWLRFVQQQIDEGIITKADMDFVQSVWDLNEELKPLAQKAHYEVAGYTFKSIRPSALTFVFPGEGEVTYRGGYVPAATDKEQVVDAQLNNLDDLLNFQKKLPMVPRGFTKNRAELYAEPLDLDLMRLSQHIHSVLLFSHLAPAVKDIRRITENGDFKRAIDQVDPLFRAEVLTPWVEALASQRTTAAGKDVWGWLNRWRSRAGQVVMFANVKNSLQNLTGIGVALTLVKRRYLFGALADVLRDREGAMQRVKDQSRYMKDRFENADIYDVRDRFEKIVTDRSAVKDWQAWFQKNAYWIQRLTQEPLDAAVWLGAYEQAIVDQGSSVSGEKAHNEAVQRADAAVRQTQTSNNPEDLSPSERGSAMMKLFLQFRGWFISYGNLVRTETMIRVQNKESAADLFSFYLVGIFAPLVGAEAIDVLTDGDPIDEDEDGAVWDDYMTRALRSHISAITGAIPVWGDAGSVAFATLFDRRGWNERMPEPPLFSTLRRGVVALRTGDISEGRKLRSVLSMVSILGGVPINKLLGPALSGYELATGQADVEGQFGPAVEIPRAIITGRTNRPR